MASTGGPEARPPPLFLRLPTTTIEGRVVLGGLVALGLVASSTDRNAFLLLVAVLLAVVALSVALSAWNLRSVTLARTLPERVEAMEPFTVILRVENRHRFWPVRGLVIRDSLQTGRTGAPSVCYAPKIPPGGAVSFRYPARIRRRGTYSVSGAVMTTRFPFGLFEKSAFRSDHGRIVVHPRRVPIPAHLLPDADRGPRPASAVSGRLRGGQEISGIREYRAGDDSRRIAWRATARHARLMLKELVDEHRSGFALLFAPRPASGRAGGTAAFEAAVALAASLVREMHRRRRPVLFVAPRIVVEDTGYTGSLFDILEYLSGVSADRVSGLRDILAEVGERRLAGRSVLAVGSGPSAAEDSPPATLRVRWLDASRALSGEANA